MSPALFFARPLRVGQILDPLDSGPRSDRWIAGGNWQTDFVAGGRALTLAEAGIDRTSCGIGPGLSSAGLARAPRYAEGNPAARLTATTAGIPDVEDQPAL